jgi:hypothetical protein
MAITQAELIKSLTKHSEIKQEEYFPKPTFDPRSDMQDDHRFWEAALKATFKLDHYFYSVLHLARICGTQIQLQTNGQYALKPTIDETGEIAWKSQAEYNEFKQEYLIKYRDQIIILLDSWKEVTDAKREEPKSSN